MKIYNSFLTKLFLPTLLALSAVIPRTHAGFVATIDLSQTDADTFAFDGRWEGIATDPNPLNPGFARVFHPLYPDGSPIYWFADVGQLIWSASVGPSPATHSDNPLAILVSFTIFDRSATTSFSSIHNIYETDGRVLLDPLYPLEYFTEIPGAVLTVTRADDGLGAHVVLDLPRPPGSSVPDSPVSGALLASTLLGLGYLHRRVRHPKA